MSTHELVLLHFNDVYHLSKRDDIARFLTHLERCRTEYHAHDPYTIFSGDVFSPSLEASILRGAHMLPLLRALRIDVACYGNHDFDFGEARLRELAAETDFPWLLSNVIREGSDAGPYSATSMSDEGLIADAHKFHTVVLQGFKVGFLGLAGTDWPSNCRELPPCTIASPVEVARACARYLRQVEKCDFVVALTHMRLPEDVEVSRALGAAAGDDERVDLLLGGHDHGLCRRFDGETSALGLDSRIVDCGFASGVDPSVDGIVPSAKGNIRIVKSGTDWRHFSCVRLNVSRTASGVATLNNVIVEQVSDIRKVRFDSAALQENRRRVDETLRDVDARIDELGREPLVHTLVPLEGTGAIVRSQESNLCNMLADMVRAYYDVDIAFVNSGGVRCDKVLPVTMGPESQSGQALTVRDLVEILPFNNEQVVKRVSRNVLLDALENSVCDANTDGRFLQMAGLTVLVEPAQPEGHRIRKAWFHPLNGVKEEVCRDDGKPGFTVAMASFIANGLDGYVVLKDEETIVGEEGGVTDTQLLLRTLGYGNNSSSTGATDDNEADNANFARARRAIVTGQSEGDGLPVVAPRLEGRITFVASK